MPQLFASSSLHRVVWIGLCGLALLIGFATGRTLALLLHG
jgi:hypothetical protein